MDGAAARPGNAGVPPAFTQRQGRGVIPALGNAQGFRCAKNRRAESPVPFLLAWGGKGWGQGKGWGRAFSPHAFGWTGNLRRCRRLVWFRAVGAPAHGPRAKSTGFQPVDLRRTGLRPVFCRSTSFLSVGLRGMGATPQRSTRAKQNARAKRSGGWRRSGGVPAAGGGDAILASHERGTRVGKSGAEWNGARETQTGGHAQASPRRDSLRSASRATPRRAVTAGCRHPLRRRGRRRSVPIRRSVLPCLPPAPQTIRLLPGGKDSVFCRLAPRRASQAKPLPIALHAAHLPPSAASPFSHPSHYSPFSHYSHQSH
jgi:hypothetical protein